MKSSMQMELKWIENENSPRPEPRIRLEGADVSEGTGLPVHYEATLTPCGDPRCPCLNILVKWRRQPDGPGMASSNQAPEFWFDLNERSVLMTPEMENDPESPRLAEIVRAELTEADRQKLREWFFAEKLEIIQTTPIEKISLANLPDAAGAKMIGFVEIFPCGLALNFTINNEVWAVDEQYCVQPGCRCKGTALSFLKVIDAAGQQSTRIKHPPAIRYDYSSGAVEELAPWPAEVPSPKVLLAALKQEHETLNLQLNLRHTILQYLYARQYLEENENRLKSLASRAPPAGPRKVGRNEPCPCGSGRKYKHCCLKSGG
jgi:hypothetical protein